MVLLRGALRPAWAGAAVLLAGLTGTVGCGRDVSADAGTTADVAGAPGRVSWTQPASSVDTLRQLTYRLYINGTLVLLSDTACLEEGRGEYECSASFPPLPPGRYSVQLSSMLNRRESARSTPVSLSVGGGAMPAVVAVAPGVSAAEAEPSVAAASAPACDPSGTCYDVRVVGTGLSDPAGLSATPDGRLFFIEAGHTVRVVDGSLRPAPALTLAGDSGGRIAGLAVDSAFGQTRAMYVAWTESRPDGSARLNVTRYREIGGVLGEGAQILTGWPVPPDAAVPVAVDAAGLVYVALPGGTGEPFGGSILRIDRDGLTPASSPGASPVVASGLARPTALEVDSAGGRLWMGGQSRGAPAIATVALGTASGHAQPVPAGAPPAAADAADAPVGLTVIGTAASPVLAAAAAGGVWLSSVGTTGALAGFTPLTTAYGVATDITRGADGTLFVAASTSDGSGLVVALTPHR